MSKKFQNPKIARCFFPGKSRRHVFRRRFFRPPAGRPFRKDCGGDRSEFDPFGEAETDFLEKNVEEKGLEKRIYGYVNMLYIYIYTPVCVPYIYIFIVYTYIFSDFVYWGEYPEVWYGVTCRSYLTYMLCTVEFLLGSASSWKDARLVYKQELPLDS